jgi:spermidine/putrescine transport system ATP-binding protein
VLDLVSISKSYGSTCAVDDLSLSIASGEVFSLLGPSGCGKTTLLRLIAGLETPDAGSILLDGEDITTLPPHQRPVNTVFQSYALFPHLSVRENIAFGPRMRGIKRASYTSDVDAVLALTRLDDQAMKYPAQLSGGQKQRVALARALVNRPRLLLLDEPFAALDLKLRQHLLAELQAVHREVGTTFVFVTHDQTEAMALSHRIAVMNAGRIEQLGTARAIYDSPRTEFVAAFIGDTNFLSGQVRFCHDRPEGGWLARVQIESMGEVTARTTEYLPEGAQVRLSARPEAWWLSTAGSSRIAGMNSMRGRVDAMLFLGATTRFTLSIGTQQVIVHHACRAPEFKLNQEVWLGFHHDDAVVVSDTMAG